MDSTFKPMNDSTFKPETICDSCPCLNNTREDAYCNLDSNVHLRWKMDKELTYSSNECKLNYISYSDFTQAFQPEVRLVTKTRPEHWVE